MKQEWQKSSAGTRQTNGKNMVWIGEIERILAKLSKSLLLTVLHLNYFMVSSIVRREQSCGRQGLQSKTSDLIRRKWAQRSKPAKGLTIILYEHKEFPTIITMIA